MKHFSQMILLALSFTSLSAFANPEGSWFIRQSSGPVQFEMTFVIQTNQTTLINVCSMHGQSLQVQATAPSSYTANTLTVMGHAQEQKSANGLNCDVSVRPGSMQYIVSGNQLILRDPSSGEQVVLNRK